MSQTIALSAAAEASIAVSTASAVSGSHRLHLRLEGALMLVFGVVVWRQLGGSWGWFAACFLVPDITLAGYLAGPRVGAWLYNLGHSLVGPAMIAALGANANQPSLLLAAALWLAHIGFDRMAGYGLKAVSGFRDTHLGRL